MSRGQAKIADRLTDLADGASSIDAKKGRLYGCVVMMRMPSRIPEAAKSSKALRCLWVLKLLSEEPLHFTELAVLFGVSDRAIQRDVFELKRAGVQIVVTRRGYELQGEFKLPF